MISGEMHYPRVPREAWRQRMKMAKAMGLNTIGTYVFWNMHEPEKGKHRHIFYPLVSKPGYHNPRFC